MKPWRYQTKIGYVYFAKHPRRDIVKIGFSDRPEVRVRQLSYGPRQYGIFRLIGCIVGTYRRERATHRLFAASRIKTKRGTEYFRYSEIRVRVLALVQKRNGERKAA